MWRSVFGLLFLLLSVSVSASRSCPSGFFYFSKSGFCYKRLIGPKTPAQFRRECQILKADLASIHTDEENNFVKELAYTGTISNDDRKENALIGMYLAFLGKNLDSDHWMWTDRSEIDYRNFGSDKGYEMPWPKTPYGCAVILTDAVFGDGERIFDIIEVAGTDNQGKWADSPCDHEYRIAVCKGSAQASKS